MENNDIVCRTFVGQTVKVGDEVVYLAKVRRGNTFEKYRCIGRIGGALSEWNIDIFCTYSDAEGERENLHKIHNPADIICKTGDGMTFWWREDGRES